MALIGHHTGILIEHKRHSTLGHTEDEPGKSYKTSTAINCYLLSC